MRTKAVWIAVLLSASAAARCPVDELAPGRATIRANVAAADARETAADRLERAIKSERRDHEEAVYPIECAVTEAYYRGRDRAATVFFLEHVRQLERESVERQLALWGNKARAHRDAIAFLERAREISESEPRRHELAERIRTERYRLREANENLARLRTRLAQTVPALPGATADESPAPRQERAPGYWMARWAGLRDRTRSLHAELDRRRQELQQKHGRIPPPAPELREIRELGEPATNAWRHARNAQVALDLVRAETDVWRELIAPLEAKAAEARRAGDFANAAYYHEIIRQETVLSWRHRRIAYERAIRAAGNAIRHLQGVEGAARPLARLEALRADAQREKERLDRQIRESDPNYPLDRGRFYHFPF